MQLILVRDFAINCGYEPREVTDMLQISYKQDSQSEKKITVFLNGCLDISTVSILNDEIANLSEFKEVVIDFTDLTFIDSTGIGALLDIIYNSRQSNTLVEFYGLNEYIKEIFETVGIIRVLEAVQRKC